MILEPEGAFLIHVKTIYLRFTFGPSPLDMRDPSSLL
jgi:hypothetical protein